VFIAVEFITGFATRRNRIRSGNAIGLGSSAGL